MTTWAQLASISVSNTDQGTDSPASARAQIKATMDAVNVIIAARGAANGIPSLDASGLVPATQLPMSQVLAGLLPIDGANSGLDADLLDGYHGASYVRIDGSHDFSLPTSLTTGQVVRRRTASDHSPARAVTLRATNSPAATAAGYGVELAAEMGNDAGDTVYAGAIGWQWADPSASARYSDIVLRHMSLGTDIEGLRITDRKLQVTDVLTDPGDVPPLAKYWLYVAAGDLRIMDHSGTVVSLTTGSAIDHNSLLNLTTGDPHTQYFRPDGVRPMTADLPLGAHSLLATDLGADPSAPSAGQVKWYTKGGQLYYRNSSAIVGPIIAGGVTDHGALTGLADDDHTQYLLRQPTADVVLNDAGGDFNLRIESDGNADMFVLDGGLNSIGIGAAPFGFGRLEVSSTTGQQALIAYSTDNVAVYASTTTGTTIQAVGEAQLILAERDSGVGTPTSALMRLHEAGAHGFRLLDLDGQYDADLLRAKIGATTVFSLLAGEAVFNDGGASRDFRVESNNNTHMLFVNGAADTVGVNSTLTTGMLNIEASSGVCGLYAMSEYAAAAIVAESRNNFHYAIEIINTYGTGRGLYCQSMADPSARFVRDLQGLAPSITPWAVSMEVADVGDTADVLTIVQKGSGGFLSFYDASDPWTQFPVTGGAYWKYLASDMATPPAGMWGIFAKADGWFQISPDGDVSQLGSGGGIVTSDAGVERRPDYIEEELTLSGNYVSMAVAVPAHCLIESVLVEVTQAVTGGYHVGYAYGDTTWGDTVSGTLGATNIGSKTWPGVVPNHDAFNLTISCPSGSFASGKVRVTVFFIRFTMP